jgi:hypothetical protein
MGTLKETFMGIKTINSSHINRNIKKGHKN